MITVHDTFVCKPGNASKIATLFKEWAELEKTRGQQVSIMTDMTGQFHRVIAVSTYENLAAYEENIGKTGDSPEYKKLMEKFKDMNDLYVSGSREIFKMW